MENDLEDLKANVSSLTLKKMSKGYQWEIKVYHEDVEEQIKKVNYVDGFMRKLYGDSDSVKGGLENGKYNNQFS